MSVYYEESETFTLACDQNLTEVVAQRTRSIKTVTMDESTGSTRAIADTDGAVTVDLAGLTEGQWLFIETDAELDVKLNGAAQGFLLKPRGTTKASLKIVEGSFTSVVLQNLQVGTTANVKTVIAGAT